MRCVIALVCALAHTAAYTARSSKHAISALAAGVDPSSCVAVPEASVDNKWCETNCANTPPNCPASLCACEGGLPSPSPVASAIVAARPPTPEQQAANKDFQEREKAQAEAEEARLAEEKARLEEDAQRVAQADQHSEKSWKKSYQETQASVAATNQNARVNDKTRMDWEASTSSPAANPYSSPGPKRAVALGSSTDSCVAVEGATVDDSWCKTNCGNSPPNCPPTMCSCDGGMPSPSPVAMADGVPVDGVRPPTPEQQASAKALEDMEKQRAQAEAERQEAEKQRMQEDAERVSEIWGAAQASPSPLALGTRPATPEQEEAARALEAAEKERAQAEAARASAEAQRMDEDAERVSQANQATGSKWDDASASPEPTSKFALALAGASCVAVEGAAVDNAWCEKNCAAPTPNCPDTMCSCDGGLPSPSPGAEIRPPTPEQQEAAKRVAENDKARQDAEAARAKEEMARMDEDAKRIADTKIAAGGAQAAASPVPLPAVPGVVDVPPVPVVPTIDAAVPAVEPRPMTADEQDAEKARTDMEKAREEAEAARTAAEEERLKESEQRVNDANKASDSYWKDEQAAASPAP
jgi:hypothetical protein